MEVYLVEHFENKGWGMRLNNRDEYVASYVVSSLEKAKQFAADLSQDTRSEMRNGNWVYGGTSITVVISKRDVR